MLLHTLFCVLCVFLSFNLLEAQDAIIQGGYRLPNNFQYLALAPKTVRPDQTYNVFVTIYRIPYSHITVRATLSRNGEEYASGTTVFTQKGTKNVQLLIPITALPGDHKLTIEGLINDGFGVVGINGTGRDPVVSASNYQSDGQPVFKNETMVHFHTKYVSLFVTTDRPVYFPPNKVYFRVLGVTPGLDPINGVMTIYVKDSNGVIIRRWLQKQLNFGVYADHFDIPYPVSVGNWTITVEAFGHLYHQQFLVKFFFQKRFDVMVKCPLFMFDTEWGFSCSLEAEHTSSRAVDGNATLSIKIRNADGSYMMGQNSDKIQKRMSYLTGVAPFDFTMKAIEKEFGDVSDKEIVVIAEVYEFWSMEAIEGTAVIKVKKDGVIIKALGKKFRAFKPKSPFEVVFVVQRSDGTPYEGFLNRQIAIQLIYEGNNPRTIPEEKVVVPDDSVVRYTVTPEEGDVKITIRAWHVVTMQTVQIECYRYWSEKNKFISVTTSTVNPTVNEYMVLTVRTNFFVDEIDYLVMGQGNILLGSSLTMKKLQKSFALALSRDMAPAARILVYCIVDGIILTDALNFHVADKRLHKAELIINRGKDFKGDHVELIGKGVPGAFISFQGHDWEFHRRGASTFINERRVIRELLTYNEGLSGTDFGDFGNDVDLPFQQTWYYPDDRWEGSVFFTAPTSGINHETTFNVSGLVALSDMNLTVTPESTPCNRTLGEGRCLNGNCFNLRYLCDGTIQCTEDGYDEMACPIKDTTPPRPSEIENLHLAATFFTDGDWLWHTTYVKYYGQTELMVKVPNTDANFAISAFVIHPEEGLAIVDQPQEYDTTRQFFMTMEGPKMARRGEQLGVRCTVFNQWDQEQQVIMMLHGSDHYRFVVVEEFGIVRSYDPRTLSGDVQIMVWLPASSSKYIHFPVLPKVENDEVTITISAYSMLRTATETLTVEISYDGVENDDQEPYIVDLVNQGSVIIPDFDIPIPERFFIPEQRELLYVPGSNDAFVYVYGGVVSPGFFADHLDCANHAEFPHDSADGYMYEFAVNLQTLRYLQTTNALSQEAERKALSYMKSIVARQYAYMMPDGAFRMFRRTDKPCVWLTSFVLHHFHKCQMSEWNEEVFIDMNTLNQVANWLADQFNQTTKRYEETAGYLYDRDMTPISIDENGVSHEWHIPLTAQVVITLAQATRITGSAKGKADVVVSEACNYLASKLLHITNPFQMAIVAYALNVANHGVKEDAYALLKNMKRETEFVYWSELEVPPNDVQIVNTRQLMQPKEDWFNTGHAVSATSYALMLYLAHNEFEASRPIMKWLQTQHNGFMAWSSSRDGLLALQALTDYAFRETNRDIYQMQLVIEATQPRDPQWKHTVYLNRTNFAHLHEFRLDRAWGEFRAYAQGTGYAYMHVSALSKVEKPWLVQTPEFKNFELRLDEANFYGRNASHINMTWCIKWIRPDMAPQSGMTFLVIDIPTGYVVARNVIEWMYVSGVPGLKRVRYRESTLYVFFEAITQQPICFEYMMERWYPVANISIPHQAKVFEYTETGNQLNMMYETYTLFHLHICQVCGSFQCPYCPFYNTAPSTTFSTLTMLTAAILGVIIGQFYWLKTELFDNGR